MTDKEIKEAKSLRWLANQFPKVENPNDNGDRLCNCINLYCTNAAKLIERQAAENDDLFYKLTGIMHFVDKWLDGDELKQDEVNRAATMREKTLKIMDSLQAAIDNLTAANIAIREHGYKSGYKDGAIELVERLKKKAVYSGLVNADIVYKVHIDNILKEMVGVSDG